MDYKPPTREQEDSYLKQIGYPRKQLEADVRILREWLVSQPHFPLSSQKEDDDFLIKFLVGCKGSLEKCKRKLDNYYSYRNSNNLMYENWDLSSKELGEAMGFLQAGVLPEPMDDGTKVVCFKVIKNAPASRASELHTLPVMVLEQELRTKGIWPMSYCIIADFKELQMEELIKMSPLVVRDFFYVIQEIMPVRVKKIIMVHAHSTVSGLINYLILPVLPKKVTERFHVTSSGWESIPSDIPKSILPKEAGGVAPSLETISEELFKKLKAKRNWFVHALSEKTDESKRPAGTKNNELEGSFKKLQVD